MRNRSQPPPIFLISPPLKKCGSPQPAFWRVLSWEPQSLLTIASKIYIIAGLPSFEKVCRRGIKRVIPLIISQGIIMTKSMQRWLQQARPKTLTTSIIRFSSASTTTIPTATSTSLSSVETVVRMEAMGIVIFVNRKSVGEFYIGWPYHKKSPNWRSFGSTDRVTCPQIERVFSKNSQTLIFPNF